MINGDGSLSANNDRTAWILELLHPVTSDNSIGDCYPVLTEMADIFSYDELSKAIHEKLGSLDDGTRSIALSVDEILKNHLRSIWDRHPERQRDLKYYFQAVREYFKENFPIRTKREGALRRQRLLQDKAALSRLLEPGHMANAVRRKLINQSTQMHILYGKLYEYCCRGNIKLPANSETLQKIQMLEAAKKQVMTAVLWSVSRLCYFYQYWTGDILSDGQYRKDFLINIKDSCKDVQECKEKLQDFFPLGELQEEFKNNNDKKTDDIREIIMDDSLLCNNLLEECASCIRGLRLNIFHYKNMSFTQALKRIADEVFKDDESKKDKPILKELYKQDRKNLDKAFALQISSMNLPLYYRKELLFHIFTKHGAEFSLYSVKNQMTPSFKRVYERGRNLRLEYERRMLKNCAASENDTENILEQGGELKWFRQLAVRTDSTYAVINGGMEGLTEVAADLEADAETGTDANADAQRAVRNLLQLIYKHHFLPEVEKDETLVTSKI